MIPEDPVKLHCKLSNSITNNPPKHGLINQAISIMWESWLRTGRRLDTTYLGTSVSVLDWPIWYVTLNKSLVLHSPTSSFHAFVFKTQLKCHFLLEGFPWSLPGLSTLVNHTPLPCSYRGEFHCSTVIVSPLLDWIFWRGRSMPLTVESSECGPGSIIPKVC